MSAQRARVMGVVTATVLVSVVGASLYLMGSPADERLRRLDARRVQDLQRLAGALDAYWNQHRALPETLAAVQQEQGRGAVAVDPAAQTPYEYRVVGAQTFEVCANFDVEADEEVTASSFGRHRQGRQCFRRDVRTEP